MRATRRSNAPNLAFAHLWVLLGWVDVHILPRMGRELRVRPPPGRLEVGEPVKMCLRRLKVASLSTRGEPQRPLMLGGCQQLGLQLPLDLAQLGLGQAAPLAALGLDARHLVQG